MKIAPLPHIYSIADDYSVIDLEFPPHTIPLMRTADFHTDGMSLSLLLPSQIQTLLL